ncbi:MAG: helix-turn-helix domain-containing protein [Vulcanimicrobiaceae bacterium]
MRRGWYKTSEDRQWNGFEASSYEVLGGYLSSHVHSRHKLIMLAGLPIRSSWTCDDVVSRRLHLPGEIDLAPAGTSVSGENGGRTEFVAVELEHVLVRTAAEGMGLDPERATLVPQFQLRDPQLEHIFWALKAELDSDAPWGRLYAESLGLALASHLLRRYAPLAARPLDRGLSKSRLERVVEYIDDNLAHDLSLDELARVADVSPSHFTLLFRRSFGTPAHQYVIRRRIERATELLLAGRMPVCEVALLAGFANQSHLARWMRRVSGTTPGALRRAAQ